MKLLFMSIIIFFASILTAQETGIKTATFNVKGNCEECKKRIENAADIKGVKLAEWNLAKQVITVTYRADKVTLKEIENAVAAAGHDTKNIESPAANYNKLPDCCKYRDKKCESPKK